MSRRLAYRPRYQNMRHLAHPMLRSRKDFLQQRWTYRRLASPYQKRPLGQGLLFIPFQRFVHSIMIR